MRWLCWFRHQWRVTGPDFQYIPAQWETCARCEKVRIRPLAEEKET